MKKLFEVRDSTYKSFYVIADGYDEAVEKVKQHRESLAGHSNSVIGTDGSLNIAPAAGERYVVTLLGEMIR